MALGRNRAERGWAALASMLVLVAGCAESGTTGLGTSAQPPAPITDPVVAFAASASPGAEDSVVLAGTGQVARVRLVRAYAAASGRECREVQVATGGGSSTRLLCSAGSGWFEARTLLREGSGRP